MKAGTLYMMLMYNLLKSIRTELRAMSGDMVKYH